MKRPVPYRDFVEGAAVSLLLYYERLPECLLELPFVDPSSVPPFPHVLERGIRPPGRFEDFFNERYEEFIWDSYRDDFLVGGYQRHDSGLADASQAARRLRAQSDSGVVHTHGVSTTLWEIAEQPKPINDVQLRSCRELFAIQARLHPNRAMRERFAQASSAESMSREFVRNLAAFVMEPANL